MKPIIIKYIGGTTFINKKYFWGRIYGYTIYGLRENDKLSWFKKIEENTFSHINGGMYRDTVKFQLGLYDEKYEINAKTCDEFFEELIKLAEIWSDYEWRNCTTTIKPN